MNKQKFEYGVKVLDLGKFPAKDILEIITEWARKGWKVHSITVVPGYRDMILFEREIPEHTELPKRTFDPNAGSRRRTKQASD